MNFILCTIFCLEKKETFPFHFLIYFTIKLNHVEKRIHLKILRGGANDSHFAHIINFLRVSHLNFLFELIKVYLNVTDISKFPIICQQELPPFLFILYFFLYINRSSKLQRYQHNSARLFTFAPSQKIIQQITLIINQYVPFNSHMSQTWG